MKIVNINEIIKQGEAIVYYDPESGLIISSTIDDYFTYFVISDSVECEFVSSFPVTQYISEKMTINGESIIDVLIQGAKILAKEIETNKKDL
jgi:galactokinase/mevalonate kinase-like predicted kinase